MRFLKGPSASGMPRVGARRVFRVPPLGTTQRLSNTALAAELHTLDNNGAAPVGIYLTPGTADFINGKGYANLYGCDVPYYLCFSGPVPPTALTMPGTFYAFEEYDPRTPVLL